MLLVNPMRFPFIADALKRVWRMKWIQVQRQVALAIRGLAGASLLGCDDVRRFNTHDRLRELRIRAANGGRGICDYYRTLTVGPIAGTLNEAAEPIRESGAALERAFLRFADDLAWVAGGRQGSACKTNAAILARLMARFG